MDAWDSLLQSTAEPAAQSRQPVPTAPLEVLCIPACLSDQPGCDPKGGWCDFDVVHAIVDWPCILQCLLDETGRFALPRAKPSTPGLCQLPLPCGLSVMTVDSKGQLPEALQVLRGSMQDCVVGIDLEWCPDFVKGACSQVALLQLASATCCLLVRTSHVGMPPELLAFLRDPTICLLGFGWGGNDEKKMQHSFGIGKATFGYFLDLKTVSEALGYYQYGVNTLASQLLSLRSPMGKQVTMSNWEAKWLSRRQVCYAALDAFLPGHIFRELRALHANRPICSSCHTAGGTVPSQASNVCPNVACQRVFATKVALVAHLNSARHATAQHQKCGACGRTG